MNIFSNLRSILVEGRMSSLGGAGDFIDFGGVTEGMPGLGPIASQSHYLFFIYFCLFVCFCFCEEGVISGWL